MQLSLNHVIPYHLRDRLTVYPSDVWAKSLTIDAGTTTFIQAPSGVGKSTLTHILYGLRHDYEGTVKWGTLQPGKATDEELSALRASELSIVFQDLRLFPALTVWENIAIKNHQTNSTADTQVMQWMERLGIHEKTNARAATLSYGEQQRVAIIRALVQPFQWLLMDEPFSHLDKKNRDRAIELITEILSDRKAGMIVSGLDANNHFSYHHTLLL